MSAPDHRASTTPDPTGRESGDGQSSTFPDRGQRQSKSGGGSVASPIEWLVAGVSTLLVVGVIAFLLYDAFASSTPWPSLVVEPVVTIETAQGHLIEFRVRNEGGRTVAGLKVEGVLKRGTERIETSEVTIDYVPARSSRRGGLIFSEDPRQYRLELSAKGYDQP